jgi:hypothetical protein
MENMKHMEYSNTVQEPFYNQPILPGMMLDASKDSQRTFKTTKSKAMSSRKFMDTNSIRSSVRSRKTETDYARMSQRDKESILI